MDLFGPTRTVCIGGKIYAFVIVDDFSRFTWVIFLTHKNEVANFEVFCRKAQREEVILLTIHSDHGGKFENKALKIFVLKMVSLKISLHPDHFSKTE